MPATRTWAAIAAAICLALGLLAWTSAPAQDPPDADEHARSVREELEILEAQRAAEEADIRLAEGRLKLARDVAAHVESMNRKGYTPSTQASNAQVEILDREARLAEERLDLKETEVKIARLRRGSPYGEEKPRVGRERDLEGQVARLREDVRRLEAEVQEIQRKLPAR